MRIRKRIVGLALVLVCFGSGTAWAWPFNWATRVYGYQPQRYGSWPSDYVFPRYGFVRGVVYTEGVGYGRPDFCPPGGAMVVPAAPEEVPQPVIDETPLAAKTEPNKTSR